MSIANIAHLSSQMESLSKDQLIKLAQNPDPSIPNAQLLALTQLGKIQDTEKRMQAEQSRAQGPQPTTAQQILMQAQPQPQQMQQPQQMNMGGIVGVRGFRDGGAAAAWKASLEGRAVNGYGFENRESLTPNNLQFLQGAIPRLETQVAETQGRLSDYMRQPGAREDVGSELRAQAEGTSRDLTRARQLLAQSQPENPSTNYYGTDKAYNPESAQGYDPMMGPPQPYSPRLPPDTGARGVPPGYRSGIPLEAQDVPIGGQTYGGNQQGYGGQTHGGNQFGASSEGDDQKAQIVYPGDPPRPPPYMPYTASPNFAESVQGVPADIRRSRDMMRTGGGEGGTIGGDQRPVITPRSLAGAGMVPNDRRGPSYTGDEGGTIGGDQRPVITPRSLAGAGMVPNDRRGPPQPYSPRLPPDTRSYSERMKSGAATGYTWDKMTKALREGTTQGRKQPGYIPREGNIPAKLAEGLLGGTSRELLDPGYRNDIDDQEDFYDPRYGDASGKYTDERMEGLYIGGEDKVPSALAPSVAAGATGSKKPSAPGGLGDLDKMIKANRAEAPDVRAAYLKNREALGGGKYEKMAAAQRAEMKADRNSNFWNNVGIAGMKMASSKDPSLAGSIGEGGLEFFTRSAADEKDYKKQKRELDKMDIAHQEVVSQNAMRVTTGQITADQAAEANNISRTRLAMDYKYKQAALGVSSNTMKSIKELVTGSATGTITSELKPLAMQLFLASSRGANTAGGENALVRRVQSTIDKWEKSTDIDSPFSKQLPNSKMTIRQAYRGGKGVTAQQQAEAKQMIMDLVLREAGIQGDTNFPAVQARMQGTVGQGAAGRVAGRMDEAMKMHPNK